MISDVTAIECLRDLVETPSFSGNEDRAAKKLVGWMQRFGFSVHIDDMGNVIGRTGATSGPLIAMVGHIDTVPRYFPVRVEDGLLHGRGSVDAKGALVNFVCAARNATDIPAQILVIGATDEEQKSSGARALRERYAPDAVFIGEPSGVEGIVIGYKGQIKGSFAVSAQAGHSAGPWENALETVVDFWQALRTYCTNTESGKGVFHDLSPNLAGIEGDAEHARAVFDVRLPPEADIGELLTSLAPWQGRGTLRFHDQTPPSLQSQNAPPVRALRRAIRVAGLNPRLRVKTGTCDMNTLQGYWDAPMVAYGPGDSSLDHTMNENLPLTEFTHSNQILTQALWFLSEMLIGEPVVPVKFLERASQ